MPPKKAGLPSKTRVQKKKAAEEEVHVDSSEAAAAEKPAAGATARRSRRSPTRLPPDLSIQVEVHAADSDESAPPADPAAGTAADETSEEDPRPVGKGKGKSKGKTIAKRNFSLEAKVEEDLMEWMAEHDEVWRRGHRLYKTRKQIWAAKADEMGLPLEHIMGWWKSIKDWYVRLTRNKSGQAAKKYTDREKFIVDSLQFYQTQLPSTKSEPMKNLALTSSQATTSRVSDSEADSDQPASQLEEDDLETVERESAKAAQTSSQTSRMNSKKRRKKEVDQEEEWMKELRETMKANQQLLSQLIEEKPAASEREAFIKYVADSLRAAPVDEYKEMRMKICTLIDFQKDAPEPARPPHAVSAHPVIHQHEIYQQYQQQQPVEQYQQYQQQQPVQQYQQQPVQQYHQQQVQQYQQQSQSQMPSTSSGERLSAGSLTQLFSSSQDVLDGSLNLSSFNVDSQLLGSGSRRTSGQSLNTPPAPRQQDQD